MDPFECYTFEEASSHKRGFTGSQPQVYLKSSNYIQRQENRIPKFKIETKRVPSKSTEISEPLQGNKASLKSVIICSAEEENLGGRKEALFKKGLRSHERGDTKLLKPQ